jgi:hypothetical protein
MLVITLKVVAVVNFHSNVKLLAFEGHPHSAQIVSTPVGQALMRNSHVSTTIAGLMAAVVAGEVAAVVEDAAPETAAEDAAALETAPETAALETPAETAELTPEETPPEIDAALGADEDTTTTVLTPELTPLELAPLELD